MVTQNKTAPSSCALSPYPYFCTYVTAWLKEQPALGKTREERIQRVDRGGLTIQTTLNPKMQAAAQQEIVAKVPIGNAADIGAAAAVVEPGTGHVLAIAQNTTFSNTSSRGKTSVNWAVDTKYGGSIGFGFGSTAKMFALSQALKSGMPINSSVVVRRADANHAAFFTKADFHDSCTVDSKGWHVHNDEGSANGSIPLTVAAAKSVNTAFAGLVAKLGACSVRDLMTQMGLHQGNGQPIQGYPSPVTLGSDSTSPLTLASAYATVASGGTYCVPSPVLTINTSDHKTIALPKNDCKKVLEPDVANGVTKILKSVLLPGGTASNVRGLDGGRPVAGKTGTAGNKDGNTNETWFAGYTPQLSTAVWVGTPDDHGNTARMRDLRLGGQFYGGEVYGATIAGPIWKSIMDRASSGMPFRDFADPGGTTQFGDIVSIPRVYGMSVADAASALTNAGFIPTVGVAVSSGIAAGLVVGTQPRSRAARGSSVVMYTSTGAAAAAPTQAPTPAPPKPPKKGKH